MITKNTIDKVFETARVEEVIGDFVQLRKAGSNYKGLSPFADERTPSFMVSPVKQIWKDFSSGKGGNVISFIMEHEHYTYPEAIRYLAKKYNIEIEETEQSEEQKQQYNERESMFLVSEFARDYFHDTLLKTEKGKAIGLSYFKERGFTDETIQKFELGYAPDVWDAFTKAALEKGYQLEFLEKTGLTIVKDDKQFDRFKGRVIFPIHSMSGRVLGFGGRILTSDKKAAKYVNSPESDIYHKSNVLYGIYHAKQSIAKEDNCYLVEGYTDVISFYQKGIHNVVASSGTALTPEQIRLISRLTLNITVLFDGDAAGIRASLRGIDLILEQGMNVKVVAFPDGEDPDSFAKKNSLEDLQQYLHDHAQDFIRFKVSLLMDEVKNDPVKKAGLIRDIVISIAKIPNNIQREIYVQECAKIMDISERVLFSELAQLARKELREASQKPSQQTSSTFEVVKNKISSKKINQLELIESELIKALLIYGTLKVDFKDSVEVENEEGDIVLKEINYENTVANEIYLHLQDDEVEFSNQFFKEIYYHIIHQLNQNESINTDLLISGNDINISKSITDILMNYERHELHRWHEKDIIVKDKGAKSEISMLVMDNILKLRLILIENLINSLKFEIKELSYNDNKEIYEEKMREIFNYIELGVKINKKKGRVTGFYVN
ncbi:MAG: DNA primase [Flavobacteriaceae bacterium]|nr:DNA primase [Flavobacteriaceae bacterium]